MKTPKFSFEGRTKSKYAFLSAMAFALAFSITSCTQPSNTAEEDETETTALDSAAVLAFRNSVTDPPPGYSGPRFQLSHDYPTTLPSGGDNMPWLKVPVDFNDPNPVWEGPWADYIHSIFEYVKQGQDPNLANDTGFRTNINGQDMWFHVPWMAYDPNVGREYTHGCTSERVASVADFDGDGDTDRGAISRPLNAMGIPVTTQRFETWAVGMYNGYAGYAIGQAFPASGIATTVKLNGKDVPAGFPFPVGSAVVKVLFTTATADEAPVLANSPEWIVDRHVELTDTTFGCERQLQTVRLVQMDVAVADPRSPTRWVFGTYAYNGTKEGATAWDRMDPVGIQFGNDPESCPVVPDGQPITQSVLNTGISIYEHNGCAKRLAGPVDNPISSCMSCHAAAFTAPMDRMDTMGTNIPPIFGFPTLCETSDDTNRWYFGNRKFPEPYGDPRMADDIPLDFSLQVLVAFEQYKTFKFNGEPNECTPASVFHDTVDNSCD